VKCFDERRDVNAIPFHVLITLEKRVSVRQLFGHFEGQSLRRTCGLIVTPLVFGLVFSLRLQLDGLLIAISTADVTAESEHQLSVSTLRALLEATESHGVCESFPTRLTFVWDINGVALQQLIHVFDVHRLQELQVFVQQIRLSFDGIVSAIIITRCLRLILALPLECQPIGVSMRVFGLIVAVGLIAELTESLSQCSSDGYADPLLVSVSELGVMSDLWDSRPEVSEETGEVVPKSGSRLVADVSLDGKHERVFRDLRAADIAVMGVLFAII